MFYGGPTFYYSLDNGKLQHAIDSAYSLDSSYMDALSEQSDSLHDELRQKSDPAVLDFTQNRDDHSKDSAVADSIEIAPYATTYTYVTDYKYLENLKTSTQIGYYEEGDGVCGYIAGNLMLYYWQRRQPSKTYMPSTWYNSSGLANNSALTKNLVSIGKSLGYGTSSTPNTISGVLKRYCSDRSISATVGYYWTLINATSELNNNRPTVLFGYLNSPNGGSLTHAVTAYGRASDGSFVVHFGWANYSRVVMTVGESIYAGNTYFRP